MMTINNKKKISKHILKCYQYWFKNRIIKGLSYFIHVTKMNESLQMKITIKMLIELIRAELFKMNYLLKILNHLLKIRNV